MRISFSRRPRSLWLGLVAATISLALLALWMSTWSLNAWRGEFPNYVAIHRGNLMVFSTVWRPSDTGVLAWQSDDWMYDVSVTASTIRWRPAYVRIGNAYGGTPAFRTVMHAVSIPVWMLAVIPGACALVWLIRPQNWRGPGQCAACGYDLAGVSRNVCPECGRSPER